MIFLPQLKCKLVRDAKTLLLAGTAMALLSGCAQKNDAIILESGTSRSESGASASYDALDTSATSISINPDAAGEGDSSLFISSSAQDTSEMTVYVCGAVADSGVYELPAGSRIDDAVKAAGGFLDGADKEYLNLACEVTDGCRIQIPTKEETAALKESGAEDTFISAAAESGSTQFVSKDTKKGADAEDGTKESAGSIVNINTAGKEELCTLTGIGESRAEAIIAYRTEHGSFGKIEDIMLVDGIKDKMFAKIKNNITV